MTYTIYFAGNIHNQALDIAGNVANELELLDPTSDELSRSLMATLVDGIESSDRAVIINCMEILYKLCQKENNEDYINKCLNLKFYETLCLFLSLNDIMLLVFTLETIYALSSMGTRSCSQIMQVRGIVDQLISLVTVEAQSYGPEGCILMRVVETVPGNMLPMVAQNIANLQNVAVLPNKTQLNPAQMQIVQHPANANVVLTPQQQQQQIAQNIQMPVQQATSNTAQASVEQKSSEASTGSNMPNKPLPPSQQQSFTHEDEQYALAWLGATFERANSNESRIEQQELYRMYLVHCQKSGKHSVVNNMQFPRHVRLMFGHNVGPLIVRRPDNTELPGFHYVGIRLRAQPLPIQTKASLAHNAAKSVAAAAIESARKMKKNKLKQDAQQAAMEPSTPNTVIPPVVVEQQQQKSATVAPAQPQASPAPVLIAPKENILESNEPLQKPESLIQPTETAAATPSLISPEDSNNTDAAQQQQQPTSSVIKSMLANKVNQRVQKQKEQTIASTITTNTQPTLTTAAATNLPPTAAQAAVKVPSNAISALVNNPIMQTTPVKVGQTTIKPYTPQNVTLEQKKPILDSAPPPLAPLSGANVAKDASGRPVIIANQMLVEILDKKAIEPPLPSVINKRKLEDSHEQAKRMALDANISTCSTSSTSTTTATTTEQVTPSKNAANLYAEMAASILEDEDLEELAAEQQQQAPSQAPPLIMASNKPPPQLAVSSAASNIQNVPRQLVFQNNPPPQLKLTQGIGTQQIPTAMATIKTDHGLQTVPVILQKPMDQGQPQLIQQVLQVSLKINNLLIYIKFRKISVRYFK